MARKYPKIVVKRLAKRYLPESLLPEVTEVSEVTEEGIQTLSKILEIDRSKGPLRRGSKRPKTGFQGGGP